MVDTAFVNAATYDSASSNSAVVAKPTNTAEGDIMFALFGRVAIVEPNSIPEGWTKLGFSFFEAGVICYGLYYKVAGAAEPDTYTWGWAASAKTKVTIATYRGGFNIANPIDAFSNTAYNVSNTIVRAASMDVSNINSNLIFAGGFFKTSITAFSKPDEQDNDWVEDYDNWHTDPDIALTFCHCNWSGSGASGTMDALATQTGTQKHAFAIALNIEAAGEDLLKIVDEVLNLVESKNYLKGFWKIKDEVMRYSESKNYLRGKLKIINEVLNIIEEIVKFPTKAILKVIDEIINISENKNYLKGFWKIINEVVNITKQIIHYCYAYVTAIKASQRNIKPKVEVYFDGEENPPTIFTSEDIAQIKFLEEAQAEGETPLGAVSSNEITITFINDNQNFNPNYGLGPYFEKLLPNLLVKPYLGIEIEEGIFEWISLGYYYTGEWDADSSDIYAEVICHDRLYGIGQKDVPLIPTMMNATKAVIFETLFRAIGLTSDEYEIDATLTVETVPIAYYPKGKIRDALGILAVAFNCTITVFRNNKIKVINNETLTKSMATYTGSDMITSTNAPQRFEDIYSEIQINYYIHEVSDKTSILIINDLIVPSEGLVLNNLEFSGAPIAFVSHIKIPDNAYVTISSLEIGTWGMNIELANNNEEEQIITLEVFGYPFKITEGQVNKQNVEAYALVGEKILPINNYLIQTKIEALSQAQLLLPIVTDPKAYVECTTRGDMSLEIGYTITIEDEKNKLPSTEVIPIRYDYTYDGGLECNIKAIKKSAREGL